MKVDFKKSLDSYRAKHGEFRVLEVPAATYLMVDGDGDPNTASAYTDAIEALYPVAFTIKFASKKDLGRDYVVPPLEALWWADDMEAFTSGRDKSQWHWTAMIMIPDWITGEMFSAAVDAVRGKRAPAGLDWVRVEALEEGRCVQTLHLGPYDDEAAVLAQLHDHFIPGEGLQLTGKHHEIYLSDARKVEPARLRTILRQPVRPADSAADTALD